MKKKVYISGKISGLRRDEYMKMFGIAEQMLREKGYKVVNPTRFFLSRHYQRLCRLIGHQNAYDLTLLYDLWRLMRCDQIYKLPGWQQSKGANIESCVAYHFSVQPVMKGIIKKIDNRIEKIINTSEK
jgi:hypothetical protein